MNIRDRAHNSMEIVYDTIFDGQLDMVRKKKKRIGLIKFGLVMRNSKQRPICKKGLGAIVHSSKDKNTNSIPNSSHSDGRIANGRQITTINLLYGEQSMESNIVRCNNRILENFMDDGGRILREVTTWVLFQRNLIR